MKYDVFISYSRKDYVDENKNVIPNNEVSKFKEALTKAGVSYWFDEDGIYSGQNFVDKLVTNIESSKVFLFLSTANSNQSEWTCKEIACAAEFKKHIIPVRIDATPYNKKVLFRIADLDYIEYHTNPKKGMEDLIKSIKAHLEECVAEEKRKQEEVLQKQNENALREYRDVKLKECREKLISLEQQRDDLEKEKLTHEKTLVEINTKLQSLGLQISNLKEDERMLLGVNPSENENKDNPILYDGVLSMEIVELVKAFNRRHWIVNILELLCFTLFITGGFLYLFMTITCPYYEKTLIFSVITAFNYVGFVGCYRLMKNCKDGVYWLMPVFPCLLIMAPFMFIRKNGKSAWSILKKSPKKVKDDTIYALRIFFLVIGLIGLSALYFIPKLT